jgi:hypothetical protein
VSVCLWVCVVVVAVETLWWLRLPLGFAVVGFSAIVFGDSDGGAGDGFPVGAAIGFWAEVGAALLPVIVVTTVAVTVVVRRLLAGVSEARAAVISLLALTALLRVPHPDSNLRDHIVGIALVTALLYLPRSTRSYFTRDRAWPLYRYRVHRHAGVLVVLLLGSQTIAPIVATSLESWLLRTDVAGTMEEKLHGGRVLSEVLNDAFADFLGRGSAVGDGGGTPAALASAISQLFVDHVIGVVARLGGLVSVGVLVLTVAPALIDLVRRTGPRSRVDLMTITEGTHRYDQARELVQVFEHLVSPSEPLLPPVRLTIPGRILRWQLAEDGWRALCVPLWLHRRAIPVPRLGPDSAAPQWIPLAKLGRPRKSPFPLAVTETAAGVGMGLALGAGALLWMVTVNALAVLTFDYQLFLHADVVVDNLFPPSVTLDLASRQQMVGPALARGPLLDPYPDNSGGYAPRDSSTGFKHCSSPNSEAHGLECDARVARLLRSTRLRVVAAARIGLARSVPSRSGRTPLTVASSRRRLRINRSPRAA